MVGCAPDRRHRRRPELDRRPERGVPVRPARVPGRRLDHGPAAKQLSPADLLDPEPGTSATRTASATTLPALPAGPATPQPPTARRWSAAPSAAARRVRAPRRRPPQHWVPFVGADGTGLLRRPAGCAGQPPEADDVGGSALPSNETFGVTGLDGTGSANFDVWTAAENASLGCSPTVPCSLVAVPIMGISCDPTGAWRVRPPTSRQRRERRQCEPTGQLRPGPARHRAQTSEDLAVTGASGGARRTGATASRCRSRFAARRSVCDARVNANAPRRLRLRADDPGHRAVGAVLLPRPESFLLRRTSRPASPRPATCCHRRRPSAAFTSEPSQRLRQTGGQRAGGGDRVRHLLRHRRRQRPAATPRSSSAPAAGQAADRVVPGRPRSSSRTTRPWRTTRSTSPRTPSSSP